MTYSYKTNGTCSRQIKFDIEDGKVYNIEYLGGCNGNLKAISSLVDGLTVDEIEARVKGIKCGFKSTSCSDQLAVAVRSAYEKETEQ